MSKHHADRLDRATAELLLGGTVTADQPAGPPALARLLAAARAPARPGELLGERRAMDAYLAAPLGPTPARRPRRSVRETALARMFTLRVAVVTAATIAVTGGVALAATSGALPNPLAGAPPGARATPEHVRVRPPATAGPATPGDGARLTRTPTPSLVGLCRAYPVGDDPDRKANSPVFRPLVVAAGGRDNVPAYCAAVLASAPAGDPGTPVPGGPGGRPDGLPTPSTGRPASPTVPGHPGGSGKPEKTGKPTVGAQVGQPADGDRPGGRPGHGVGQPAGSAAPPARQPR